MANDEPVRMWSGGEPPAQKPESSLQAWKDLINAYLESDHAQVAAQKAALKKDPTSGELTFDDMMALGGGAGTGGLGGLIKNKSGGFARMLKQRDPALYQQIDDLTNPVDFIRSNTLREGLMGTTTRPNKNFPMLPDDPVDIYVSPKNILDVTRRSGEHDYYKRLAETLMHEGEHGVTRVQSQGRRGSPEYAQGIRERAAQDLVPSAYQREFYRLMGDPSYPLAKKPEKAERLREKIAAEKDIIKSATTANILGLKPGEAGIPADRVDHALLTQKWEEIANAMRETGDLGKLRQKKLSVKEEKEAVTKSKVRRDEFRDLIRDMEGYTPIMRKRR